MSQNPDPQAIEPGQEVTIDLMAPRDAPGVAALFKAVYGEGYPVDTYYHPDRLIEANRQGHIISSVARTEKGDIVGHNALFNAAPYPKVHESGAGLVLPAYRRGDIFDRMVRHGVEVGGPRFGVETVYGEPVCNHVFSQRLCHKQGWVTMALEVGLMPAEAYTKEKSAQGRVSTILDFVSLVSRPRQVFLPPRYREQLEFLYAGLDDERRRDQADQPLPAAPTRIEPRVFASAQVARLSVTQAGHDLEAVLGRVEQEAAEQGVVVFQVWLPLLPWCGQAVEVLRDRGYFLGGLLPRWFDRDGLLMQRLAVKPPWDDIQLQFDRAKQIMALVRDDWQSLQGG